MLGHRFIVSSEGQGLHKMLLPWGFEPSTSCMPGKHRISRQRLPLLWLSFWLILSPPIVLVTSIKINYYGTTFDGIPGSFNSSQMNACVVGIAALGHRFIVSFEGQGMHKMLPPRGFEPSTSRMPGKHRTPRPRLPL